MTVLGASSPFGSRTRTRVLMVLLLLGESYARELSRVLEGPLSSVQAAIRSLERDGLVAGRAVGRTRLYRIDPRYFARKPLEAYLDRLLSAEEALTTRVEGLRRRPRRTGKPV
jgi:DNA-binding transcriptional ArsR family regulator